MFIATCQHPGPLNGNSHSVLEHTRILVANWSAAGGYNIIKQFVIINKIIYIITRRPTMMMMIAKEKKKRVIIMMKKNEDDDDE